MSEFATIEPGALAEKSAADVIDVRTPAEFQAVHATGAENFPLDSLDPAAVMKSRNGSSGEPLYVICKSGGRSAKAREKFVQACFCSGVNVTGGTDAWDAAGFPVERSGRKVISLDRQVRIAAGSLVLIGAVLGWQVDRVWIGLSAFVGVGLVFAGLTDTCGMGMLLSKMPWNQVSAPPKPQPKSEACETG